MNAHTSSRKVKKVLLILALMVMLGCSFPLKVTLGISGTPTPSPTLAATATATLALQATPEPGTENNPLILALVPSAHPDATVIAAGDAMAAYIEARTGYRVVTINPNTEVELVTALSKGNAHIASLSPYAYALARQDDSVAALFAQTREGEAFYGAQIIVNREKDFTPYYDEARGENTGNVDIALQQFQEKKPCWSDEVSPSGYVIPLGLLKQASVEPRSGAFLEGQPNVVRAVYADDICDFGATYSDARTSPILEADYPDVMDKVRVVWRIPPIIPYQNISMSTRLPFEMRRVVQRALIDYMLTPEGRNTLQTVYGIDEMQPVEDSAYDEFVQLVLASGLDLASLIE
ncbi:MAG TPA: PhnD/SsuA/transferrin family substrate-binding protein [Anaerolineales bacterium]|nr:PhnD/SsuA/transferrin family substrate-binding protein [Anaerolineales bacterium]HNN14591.1 PhnD/SsuA/transferrin family substrate-binding protein [Anaerolineales bacterium]HNO30852.1 PhnD/SsuA/transferrin family substrate-binding protein [Anaerolineales bacterium]